MQGNAAQVLQSLEMSTDNYKTAWDLLKSRFENKRLLIYHHIQALLELKSVYKESAWHLRNLLDDAQKHLRALQTLGEPIESWDSLVIHMLAMKLDDTTKRKWESNLQTNEMPKLNDFMDFLSRHCALLETLQPAKITAKSLHVPSTKKDNLSSHVNQTAVVICATCKGNHALYNCTKFKGISIHERFNEVKRL